MRIRVREVDAVKNIELLREMHARCGFSDCPRPSFREGYWWLAYDGEKAVGFCGIVPSKQWEETGYFKRAGVLPEYRGHGIHHRLIRVRLNKARKVGWKWVVTDTTHNPPSANNLIQAGFKMYSPKKPWSFKTASYWIREL